MEDTYSEKLRVLTQSIDELNMETTHMSPIDNDQVDPLDDGADDFWCEEESLNAVADDDLSHLSELNREWKRRHDQFHTMGYRDGITAGQEASAQDGFNVGFGQSVLTGHKWGLVRGISSALANLSDQLKERLLGTPENGDRFQKLHESTQNISSNDAQKLFYDSLLGIATQPLNDRSEEVSHGTIMKSDDLGYNQLEDHFRELNSMLSHTPEIKVHVRIDKKMDG